MKYHFESESEVGRGVGRVVVVGVRLLRGKSMRAGAESGVHLNLLTVGSCFIDRVC